MHVRFIDPNAQYESIKNEINAALQGVFKIVLLRGELSLKSSRRSLPNFVIVNVA